MNWRQIDLWIVAAYLLLMVVSSGRRGIHAQKRSRRFIKKFGQEFSENRFQKPQTFFTKIFAGKSGWLIWKTFQKIERSYIVS